MNRRAVLRAVGLGATSIAGCVGFESSPTAETSNRTTGATTRPATGGAASPTTDERTTARAETTTTADPEGTTTEDADSSPTDNCPPSAIPASRRHVHSDYALRFVRDTEHRPAVAVVGEDWRSTLRTDEMADADRGFLTGTDFDRFGVLVVQYTKSSGGHDLRVTGLNVDGRRVLAEICVVADGGTNDAPTANLLVRVPYDGLPPASAQVRIRTPTGPVTVSSE